VNISEILKNGVNWFLLTTNGVILFLSIQGLERMSQNQSTVIQAFETGAQALQQNALALEVGAKTLEDFGTYMASSVLSAADAFANFEVILDKHIELARLECEVVLGQKDAVKHLENITHINNIATLRGLSNALEKLPDTSAFRRDVDAIEHYQQDRHQQFIDKLESLDASARQGSLKISSNMFKSGEKHRGEVFVAKAANVAKRLPLTRADFLFGDLHYSFTQNLAVMCCLGVIADMAFDNDVIDEYLHSDIEEFLTPMIKTEVDRLDGELSTRGWVLAKKDIKGLVA
jgi:hypothetical protein